MKEYSVNRGFMKSGICDIDIIATADIAKGIPQPPIEKPSQEESEKIALPTIERDSAPKADFFSCTLNGCSRRQYIDQPLSLFELAFLLWCTQGVKKVIDGYYQNKVDKLIDVDGHNEFVVLCASVGHIDEDKKDVYQHFPDLR